MWVTGLSKNLQNFPDLLSDDRKGKIIEISTLNILAIERLLRETL